MNIGTITVNGIQQKQVSLLGSVDSGFRLIQIGGTKCLIDTTYLHIKRMSAIDYQIDKNTSVPLGDFLKILDTAIFTRDKIIRESKGCSRW